MKHQNVGHYYDQKYKMGINYWKLGTVSDYTRGLNIYFFEFSMYFTYMKLIGKLWVCPWLFYYCLANCSKVVKAKINIFFISENLLNKFSRKIYKNIMLRMHMMKYVPLAIIYAFTAIWGININQMSVVWFLAFWMCNVSLEMCHPHKMTVIWPYLAIFWCFVFFLTDCWFLFI